MALAMLSWCSAVPAAHVDNVARPYPPSPVIEGLTIAPESERLSIGHGDNWPMTWADDDLLYTVYADGTGFSATDGYSLGQAKILGSPPAISGQNIASPTGEIPYLGNEGPNGKKSSGLIMADGTLYMWVRNLSPDGTGAALAWSSDHARSWTWAPWSFPTMGYPVWLNYGKNNAGARDDYLYFYSPDTNSAYTVTDTIVLGRVPKARVREKSAYRFFEGLDSAGNARWSADWSSRKPVLKNPGRCYRPEVVYDAGIKRYLLATMTTWGHLGVFDAPEPWGPWTTVYFTDQFSALEDRFQPRIPAKWMSADGTRFFLAYSAYPRGPYAFNVQAATLKLRALSDIPSAPPTGFAVPWSHVVTVVMP